MTTPLISIVIPIYNSEEYLTECVNSVINQTYKNIEIILVDDGSTDNSPKMCDEYALKDNRVNVIHKENGGVSSARNIGIKQASGDYIMFVDSDDYLISNELFDKFYDINKNKVIDCLVFNRTSSFKSFNINLNTSCSFYDEGSNFLYDVLSKKNTYPWFCTNYIFNKSLFNNIKFPEGYVFEEIPTVYKALVNCSKVCYLNEDHYFYRFRHSTLSTSSNVKTFKNHIDMCVTAINDVNSDKSIETRLKKLLLNNFVAILCSIPEDLIGNNIEVKEVAIDYFNNNINYLNYAYKFKQRVLAYLIKILGVKTYMKVIGLIK